MICPFIELGSPGTSHTVGFGGLHRVSGFLSQLSNPNSSKMATRGLRVPRSGSASPTESQNLFPKSLTKNPETDSSLTDLSLGLSPNALLTGRWMVTWPGLGHEAVLSLGCGQGALSRTFCTVNGGRPVLQEIWDSAQQPKESV